MEFVVLPDHPAAAGLAARLPAEFRRNTLHHHSGRPWLTGNWPAHEIIHARAGTSHLVLLGPAGTTEARLGARLERVNHAGQLDTIAAETTGAFHLIASLDGTVRVQGPLSGCRPVVSTTVLGVTVAANRASALGRLRRLTLSDEQLALHLLAFAPPWPLAGLSVWREVDELPFAHCLTLRPDGTGRAARWWSPPEPEVPAGTAAPLLRRALVAAVAARADGAPVLGSDLSGGMDSTSLCFLAAGQRSRLVTVRRRLMDPANCDDPVAHRAGADLPGAEHVVLDPGSATLHYEGVDRTDLTADEPPPFIALTRYMEVVARTMAAHGVTRHLQGHGSDELAATGTAAYVNTAVRRRPVGSLGLVRAMRARRRWSLATTARVVRRFPSYADWLYRSADGLLTPADPRSEIGWEPLPKLPRWSSPETAALVRGTIRRTAGAGPPPLARDAVQHEILRCVQENGRLLRFANTLAEPFGVSFEAPFLDDRVVRAALSVRPADRHSADRHKPVLAAALRGTVPDYVLDRTTKSHFTMDVYEGRRRNLATVRAMFEESRLVARGLVDPSEVRRALTGAMPDPMLMAPLEKTIALEAWLRSLPDRAGPRPS
ncbi:asparagine synthase-related protein [Streptomyces sp. NPDC003691]